MLVLAMLLRFLQFHSDAPKLATTNVATISIGPARLHTARIDARRRTCPTGFATCSAIIPWTGSCIPLIIAAMDSEFAQTGRASIAKDTAIEISSSTNPSFARKWIASTTVAPDTAAPEIARVVHHFQSGHTSSQFLLARLRAVSLTKTGVTPPWIGNNRIETVASATA